MDVLATVKDFIASHQLLSFTDLYVVGLSGGADSVALLLMLRDLGYHVHAAHCNFRLRGEESERDEAFCATLCDRLGVPMHRAHFDTQEYALLHHLSIETAARQLRYGYFTQLVRDIGAKAVCVAHHRDDSVESVLLHLMRGTGVNGLRGILPVNELSGLSVIRPLLCLQRTDIEAFLHERQQKYVTDSTNLDPQAALRNRIRLQLLPLMNDIAPGASQSIAHTAENMQQAAIVVDNAMHNARLECFAETSPNSFPTIYIDALLLQPSPEYVLFDILKDYGFTSRQATAIARHLDAPTGTLYHSPTHRLLFHRGLLLIDEQCPTDGKQEKELRIPEPGTYIINDGQRLRVSIEKHSKKESTTGSVSLTCKDTLNCKEQTERGEKETYVAFAFDDERASDLFPLTVRLTREGDRFRPFGMKGTKLVSDYLTDRHHSLFQRQRQLVLTDARGNILWLVSERRAEGRRIDDHTSCILHIDLL